MKKTYLRTLERKLFVKYMAVLMTLCLGGAIIIYLFDNVLNGVVIDFIRLFAIESDPFTTFRKIFTFFLPTVIVITALVLMYFLCKSLVHYMKVLLEGMDDVMTKDRVKIKFPAEMKPTEDLLLRIAEEYRLYQKAAQEDEDKKKDLVYLLAQDIKLPLSNILMYLDFLQKEKRISPEIKKDFMMEVLYKSLHLEDMINEFFDITRFNLQYAKWTPEHMYLDRLMEQVVDESYEMMEEKQMKVNLVCKKQLLLYADIDKIARVMRDLLRNLITLAKENSIVQIRIEDSEDFYSIMLAADVFHLSAYQVAHIFHNFYRMEDMQKEGKQHVLGLGIAKQIMDMHKGSLRASSIGDTLSFYVDIPKREIHKET